VQTADTNYFRLFSLPESFTVDLNLLAENYRQLQMQAHPDRVANASEQEKLQAVHQASLVNEGYATLKSPLKRAGYLLQRQQLDVSRVGQNELGMDLLMEQMQLREALENMPRDEAAHPQLQQLQEEVRSRLAKREQSFARDLENKQLETAKVGYHEMQFLHKLLAEIELVEEQQLGY